MNTQAQVAGLSGKDKVIACDKQVLRRVYTVQSCIHTA